MEADFVDSFRKSNQASKSILSIRSAKDIPIMFSVENIEALIQDKMLVADFCA